MLYRVSYKTTETAGDHSKKWVFMIVITFSLHYKVLRWMSFVGFFKKEGT